MRGVGRGGIVGVRSGSDSEASEVSPIKTHPSSPRGIGRLGDCSRRRRRAPRRRRRPGEGPGDQLITPSGIRARRTTEATKLVRRPSAEASARASRATGHPGPASSRSPRSPGSAVRPGDSSGLDRPSGEEAERTRRPSTARVEGSGAARGPARGCGRTAGWRLIPGVAELDVARVGRGVGPVGSRGPTTAQLVAGVDQVHLHAQLLELRDDAIGAAPARR